mgnify:CR=1 FL=1
MAKQSGLGDYIAVDDSAGTPRDISNDITSYSIGNPQSMYDMTGLNKSAMERLIGLNDLTVTLNGYFNPASNKSHDVFKVRTGTRTFDLRVGGDTSTNPKLTAEMLIGEYNLDRGDDGGLTWTVSLSLESGTVPAWTTVA